tara:strand:- start:169 stop:1554 length:1386 start_codon:yes stop_codon:yes gene_type:complete
MKELDKLVENFLQPKRVTLGLGQIVEMIEEATKELENTLEKPKSDKSMNEEKRFSMTIPIPKLTPTEAWGDPNSQSRQEIDKIFASISGGADIKERIQNINRFLNPESATRKRSPSNILNMMMITEALQATLNDFGDSPSGFVFEGFLAALFGGRQQADKVSGTLPIEDFVAFSEFGKDVPVSLKLLSGKTPIKGSYTNLADFLVVRGTPAIKYLIAYKQKTGKGVVEKLNILAFDITLENFVDFMKVVSGGSQLIKPEKGAEYHQYALHLDSLLKAFAANPSDGDLQNEAAMAIHGTQGYNRKLGQIDKWFDDLDYGQEPSEDEKEKEEKERAARSQQDFEKTKIDESINEELLLEAGERQWAASLSQLKSIASVTNLESYGTLDLSQQNIDDLVEIYTKKLGNDIMTLLETTKKLTENIGTYFSSEQRGKAQQANKEAQTNSEDVKGLLIGDPLKDTEV